MTIKKIIFISLLVLGYIFYYSCWKDHSKILKKLGNNVNTKVLAFYKEHQRYPTFEEGELFWVEVGCAKIKNINYYEFKDMKNIVYSRHKDFNCSNKLKSIRVYTTIGTRGNPYSFGLERESTACSVFYDGDGDGDGDDGITCTQSFWTSCILTVGG